MTVKVTKSQSASKQIYIAQYSSRTSNCSYLEAPFPRSSNIKKPLTFFRARQKRRVYHHSPTLAGTYCSATTARIRQPITCIAFCYVIVTSRSSLSILQSRDDRHPQLHAWRTTHIVGTYVRLIVLQQIHASVTVSYCERTGPVPQAAVLYRRADQKQFSPLSVANFDEACVPYKLSRPINVLKLKASTHLCAPRSQQALTLYTQRQTALLRPMYPVSAGRSLAVKPLNSTVAHSDQPFPNSVHNTTTLNCCVVD